VIIRLGAATTPHFAATKVVGLASIHNEDSDFWFATDSATVDIDPADSTLRLNVPIAVKGNPSLLSRFSYMVNVPSDPITSKIAVLFPGLAFMAIRRWVCERAAIFRSRLYSVSTKRQNRETRSSALYPLSRANLPDNSVCHAPCYHRLSISPFSPLTGP
jgi:hypothetical protein